MSFRSVVKKVIPDSVFAKVEPAGHLAEAVLLNVLHGFPTKGLKIIGVTGTNGKTTTCFLIYQMLKEAGYKVGIMSSVAYGYKDDIKPQIEHMTTVPVPLLIKRLKWLKRQGAQWVVLETTSHALAQHRVWGLPYEVAVMTNVTHEHLDYHRTFKNYLAAKVKLFKQTAQNRKGLALGVINADDEHAANFSRVIGNKIFYGQKAGDLIAYNAKLTTKGSHYSARIGTTNYQITCGLPGSFNLYNSLAAVAVGHGLGLSKTQIEHGIATLIRVEGRMDPVDEGQNYTVIVDFAHTPDSFEKLFKDLKPVAKGKLIAVFGSAGRRDEAKRAIQGELAGKYCDEVVVTEEDDRDVDGIKIMDQIAAGAEKAGKHREKDLFLIHDRTEAINFAISCANKDDTILLLGKGHEKTIERADGEHSWDEIGTARRAVINRLKK